MTHDVLKHLLAGGALASVLLAPAGAHSIATLFMWLLLLVSRLTLYVGAPAWAGGVVAAALARRARRAAR